MSADSEVIKKKRGRKKKCETELSNNITVIIEQIDQPDIVTPAVIEQTNKKRGRKPKGGKLIEVKRVK